MNIPSYYAVLPANVRYDATLSNNEKLLYAELTSLSGKGAYFILEENYLENLYGLTSQTIKSYLSSLEKRGYIQTETTKDGRQKVTLQG